MSSTAIISNKKMTDTVYILTTDIMIITKSWDEQRMTDNMWLYYDA